MDIQCKTEKKKGTLIFTITHRSVNHNNAASLKEKIFLEIADGNSKLVMDLTQVNEMDSSGLGALLFGKRQANNAGGNMVFVGVNQSIQTMIRIAQLARVFEIFPTLDEAVDSLQ